MHIYQLALCGLLLVGISSAQNSLDAALFNSNFYGEDNYEANVSPYWWMNKGSPFKRSYAAASAGVPQAQAIDFGSNPFLSGKPFAAADSFSSATSNSNAFSGGAYQAPGYLPPTQTVKTVPCSGNNRVCVAKYLCNNGFVDASQANGASSQQCNVENEVCCSVRVPPPPPPPTRPPPPPPPPQPQAVPCLDRNSVCVLAYQCVNGVVAQTNGFGSKAPAQKCFAPQVCCRQQEQRPTPSTHNDVYQTTQRPHYPSTPSQVLTSEGYVITVPDNRYPTTQRPYVPPVQTQRPYVPPQPTPRPYVPPAVQTQRPFVPQPVTRPPFQGDKYIPPRDNHQGDSSNQNPLNYLPPDESGSNDSPNLIPIPSQNDQQVLPPIQCPAATNCTEIQFCASDGTISKTPVILSKEQEIFRVPLSDCRDVKTGIVGKCCRDKDYTDPWPTSILGQYNASILGFDDGSYKPGKNNGKPGRVGPGAPPSRGFNGQGQQNLPQQTQTQYSKTPFPNQPTYQQPNAIPQRDKPVNNYQQQYTQKPYNPQPYQPQQPQQPQQPYQPQQPFQPQQPQRPQSPFGQHNAPSNGVCAARNPQGVPQGVQPNDAAFGEFPWQAMVLKESTKSILCGGAIIEGGVVATAAHCVDGLRPNDVLVKAGEWKLGSDEEPKPFQTIRVKSISQHPAYQPTNLESDVALLHLESQLSFDKHIGPICIDENDVEPSSSNEECVTSGWGKEIIKYHVANSIPHSLPISPLSPGECQAAGASSVCGRAQANPCDVDAGSALACTKGNGKYVLKGIYSGEAGCASNQVVSFAKMDVQWINSNKNGSPQASRNVPQSYQYPVPSTQAPSYLPPRK